MICVRDILEIDPAQMKTVKDVMREAGPLMKRLNHPPTRIMTDCVGTYYTLVLEADFSDMATYEASMQATFQDTEWQALYGRIRPHVRGGRREIYSLL